MTKAGTHAKIDKNSRRSRLRRSLISAVAAGAAIALGLALTNVSRADGPTKEVAKSQEGTLEPFLGKAKFDRQQLFEGGRFPSVVVGLDGTVLAFWGNESLPRVRRGEDGGATWAPTTQVGKNPDRAGKGLGAAVVNETTGDVLIFVEGSGGDWRTGNSWRSRNNGKTWEHNGESTTIVRMNTPVEMGGKESVPGRGSTHGADSGITLRHGENKGRLLVPARVLPGGNDTTQWPKHYNCAIYSDDGGATWQTSAPFPAFGTGEGTLAELSDGQIYYNSRRHLSTDGLNARRRHIAWSRDGGQTWKDLSIAEVLPDGDQSRDYGLMAGLVRLPVRARDILVFSNIESPEGRHGGTVWASFDGGKTWPLKRLVEKGRFAYSSLATGRPDTPSEGWVYLLYEGEGGGHIARFNLAWLLGGEPTGDGKMPDLE